MSSMSTFRLWVLAGSIVVVLLCRGLQDLVWMQPASPPERAASAYEPAGATNDALTALAPP